MHMELTDIRQRKYIRDYMFFLTFGNDTTSKTVLTSYSLQVMFFNSPRQSSFFTNDAVLI